MTNWFHCQSVTSAYVQLNVQPVNLQFNELLKNKDLIRNHKLQLHAIV